MTKAWIAKQRGQTDSENYETFWGHYLYVINMPTKFQKQPPNNLGDKNQTKFVQKIGKKKWGPQSTVSKIHEINSRDMILITTN